MPFFSCFPLSQKPYLQMMTRYFACLIFLGTILSALRADFVVVGSDLMEHVVSQPLDVYASARGLRIEVEMYGTQPGLKSFENGEADILIMASPENEPRLPSDVVVKPIGFLAAYVTVSSDNPLAEISLPQLRGVFAETPEQPYSRWGELGLSGIMANRAIQPIVLDQPSSVLLELFKHRALQGQSLRSEVSRVNTEMRISELIASDASAIAITHKPLRSEFTRILSVSSGRPGEFAFDPKPENVFYNDYPLRLAFYTVFRQSEQERLQDILNLLYGDDYADLLEQEGFVALPDSVRQRIQMEWRLPQ